MQKRELDPAQLRQTFAIVIVVNLALTAAVNLSAPAIARFFGDDRLVPILRALSLQFPIIMLSSIPGALLQRRLDFKRLSLVDLAAAISSSIITLVLAFAHYGVWALVVGSLFAVLFKAVAYNVMAPFRMSPTFSWRGMRDLLSFGGNVTLTRLLWFYFTQIDVIIVGKVLGKEMLGLYSVAMHLASLPVQRVSGILNQVAFPVFSRSEESHENLGQFVIKAIRTLSFVAFPLLWGISSIANEIVSLFLGAHWEGAVIPLQLLSLIMPLRMLVNFLPSATDALGRPELGLKNVALSALVMPLAYLVATRWGIAGVAISWITVYPVLLLFNTHRMLRAMGSGLGEFLRGIAPSAAASAGMYAAVAATRALLGGTVDLAGLAVLIAVGAAAYGLLTLLINRQGCRDMLGLMGQS